MDEPRQVIERLTVLGKSLATAESCTGGLLGKLLTDVPGASRVYLGGVISYAYGVKQEILCVDSAILEEKGAVCEDVARQMAQGVRKLMKADYALATTGNAGPSADPMNPNVGEIYVALAYENGCVCRRLALRGNREENRQNTCLSAMKLLLEVLHG